MLIQGTFCPPRQDEPKGYAMLRSILAELKTGQLTPPMSQWLSEAIIAILEGSKPRRALQLTKRRGERGKGKRTPAFREQVVQFMANHFEQDPRRGARKRALDAAEQRFPSRGRRQLENIWDRDGALELLARQRKRDFLKEK